MNVYPETLLIISLQNIVRDVEQFKYPSGTSTGKWLEVSKKVGWMVSTYQSKYGY